jgi:Zn-dependent protease with chaperone function
MRFSVYIPFAVSVLAALAARPAASRLPPRTATWWLAAAAVVAAAGWCAALGLLAVTAIGQFPPLAAEGHWSAHVLRADTPVNRWVAIGAAAALLAATTALAVTGYRRLEALASARRICRSLHPHSQLVVVDDPVPHTFAVPGAAGRVVVSTGILRTLDAAQRRALLAHERSHLRNRHHWFLIATRLAAAVDPLLYPLLTAVTFTVERWADEDAAAAVNDRRLVARTLAVAALATVAHPAPALALATHQVPRRVQALLVAPPPQRRLVLALGAALLALIFLSLREAAHDTHHLFEAAEFAYQTLHIPR